MKSGQIILFLFVLAIAGCSSSDNSTEPLQTGMLGSMTVVNNSNPSLEGGGRLFRDSDTATWYDATFSFTITNTSSASHVLHYSLGVGYLQDGKFVGQVTGFLKDTAITTVMVITDAISTPVSANQTATLTIPATFYLTPVNTNRAFAYRLEVFDEANNSVVFTGLFGNTGAENRFHGILFTTEQSPDVQGLLDSADDGDWQSLPISFGEVEACYPNPTKDDVRFNFPVSAPDDSVFISLNVTPHGRLINLFMGKLSPGTHAVSFNLPKLPNPNATIRLYFHLFHDGQEYISRGDIMVMK